MLGDGVEMPFYALGFIMLAIVYSLAVVMAAWLAALLVGGVLAAFAMVIVISYQSKLRRVTDAHVGRSRPWGNQAQNAMGDARCCCHEVG
jgi:hypothetical protein